MFDIKTFRGGVHPREAHGGKRATSGKPVTSASAPQRVALLLSQSVGAPASPLVKAGERVLLYQKIAEPEGFVGAPVHASVSGKVVGIQPWDTSSGLTGTAIVIENDGLDEPDPNLLPKNPDIMDPHSLLIAIREAGIVGLGGAAFPTQVKLSPPPSAKVDTLILNGAECEPYLTADHSTMLDQPDAVVDGLMIAKKILGAQRCVIAIEANKPDAIAFIRRAATDKPIEVVKLQAKYPQGGEKQLIQAITGREVPSGKLPMDAGCVVINVTTAAAISTAIRTGKPLVERTLTVTGAVKDPKNLRVRLGVTVGELLDQCGGLPDNVSKVILGGPMMGMAAVSLRTPTVKAMNGVLLLEDERPPKSTQCIRCARCAGACPAGLLPMQLHNLSEHGLFDAAKKTNAMDCIECGCCSYVCPAKLPLVQSIRVAKRELAKQR